MVGWSPKKLTNKLSKFIVLKGQLPTILGRYVMLTLKHVLDNIPNLEIPFMVIKNIEMQ